ncbi:hypothetical protein TNCV_2376641 [Trichonephila clavipes]|nr:hypothetical protein TNCV_2376641 [Trichonephila clavipes]
MYCYVDQASWILCKSVAKSKALQEQYKFIVEKPSLKYRVQYSNSLSKSQKALTPFTALRHNCQAVKYKYVKDYSKQPQKYPIAGGLFMVKPILLFNSQNKTNSVSTSDFRFIGFMDLSRKIRLRYRS